MKTRCPSSSSLVLAIAMVMVSSIMVTPTVPSARQSPLGAMQPFSAEPHSPHDDGPEPSCGQKTWPSSPRARQLRPFSATIIRGVRSLKKAQLTNQNASTARIAAAEESCFFSSPPSVEDGVSIGLGFGAGDFDRAATT